MPEASKSFDPLGAWNRRTAQAMSCSASIPWCWLMDLLMPHWPWKRFWSSTGAELGFQSIWTKTRTRCQLLVVLDKRRIGSLSGPRGTPNLRATSSEYLDKKPNMLPVTWFSSKKWQILRQTHPVSSTVQQYQSFLMLAIKRSLAAEPGTNPQTGASHLPYDLIGWSVWTWPG
jgi:hypothetical protein